MTGSYGRNSSQIDMATSQARYSPSNNPTAWYSRGTSRILVSDGADVPFPWRRWRR